MHNARQPATASRSAWVTMRQVRAAFDGKLAKQGILYMQTRNARSTSQTARRRTPNLEYTSV
jgi:hypothetical protein